MIALFIRFFPNTRPERRTYRLDYAGMALLVLVVVPLLIGLSLGGVQYEWLSLQIVGILAFAVVMIVAFVLLERRADDPIMPLSIYGNPVVSISLVAVFITGFAMFGSIIFIPLFFQGVLGASATSSGSFLTPHDAEHGGRRHVVRTGALTLGRPLPTPGAHRHRDHDQRYCADLPYDR